MLVNRPNITEKNYRKLSIVARPDGFSFCVTDTLNDRIKAMKDVVFSDAANGLNAEDHYAKAFSEHEELLQPYDRVSVTYENGLNTFVPRALFDEHFLGSYLQYNVKVFETDWVTFDELPTYEMNNVYLPFSGIHKFLTAKFGDVQTCHASSILVSKLLEISRNKDEKQVFAYFSSGRFELIVVQNQKLLLFNSFDYRTREDFIYYLLFTAEQLNLNPEFFKLQLLGDVSQESDCYEMAYTYVRHVSLLDVSKLRAYNDFTEAENRRNFILFQS